MRNAIRSSQAIAVLAILAVSALAQVQVPTPTGFVNDYANVVDAASKERMETMARNFRDRTQIDVAVVTLPSLDGRSIEETGLQIGRQWGIGAGTEKNGLLVLVAPADRKSRIEVSRHLEDEITDGVAGGILRQARPYFAASRFGEGLQLTLESVLATIAEKQGISIEGIDQKRAYRPQPARGDGRSSGVSPIVTILVILFLFWLISRASGGGGGGGGGRRRRRYGSGPWILPFPTGGWSGGWGSGGGGGGGWGGGGSDWGGFGGGGDFGGGGASDSW
jgi:uncharacterized protein